jgi:hypothetical protein
VRRRWGDVPLTTDHLPHWAQTVADRHADTDPRVIAASRATAHAHQQLRDLTAQHADARAALWHSIGAGQRPTDLHANATQSRAVAEHARRTLAQIDALPVTDAAQLIQQRAARASAVEAALQARAADLSLRHTPAPVHEPGPERGFGPSL